ncbi:uncharacterized protein LOC141729302 [Zonotrichia albicollis]|uniref:uncharacterized protein LOC141729302 n=1 Tax=Zonotrichia albicollis TaxID=44394 RepID=UPI003D80B53F
MSRLVVPGDTSGSVWVMTIRSELRRGRPFLNQLKVSSSGGMASTWHEIFTSRPIWMLSSLWGQVWWAGTHLWPGVAGDQAGELQGLSLADGVDALGVALLLDVAGQARVHDPHRGGGVHPLAGAALQQNRQQPQQPDRYIHLHVSIHISSPAGRGGAAQRPPEPRAPLRPSRARPRRQGGGGRRRAPRRSSSSSSFLLRLRLLLLLLLLPLRSGRRGASPAQSEPPAAAAPAPAPGRGALRAPAAAAAASRGRRAPRGAAAAACAPRPSEATAAPRPPHGARGCPRRERSGARSAGGGGGGAGGGGRGAAGRLRLRLRRSGSGSPSSQRGCGAAAGPMAGAARGSRGRAACGCAAERARGSGREWRRRGRHVVLYVRGRQPQPGDVKAAWLLPLLLLSAFLRLLLLLRRRRRPPWPRGSAAASGRAWPRALPGRDARADRAAPGCAERWDPHGARAWGPGPLPPGCTGCCEPGCAERGGSHGAGMRGTVPLCPESRFVPGWAGCRSLSPVLLCPGWSPLCIGSRSVSGCLGSPALSRDAWDVLLCPGPALSRLSRDARAIPLCPGMRGSAPLCPGCAVRPRSVPGCAVPRGAVRTVRGALSPRCAPGPRVRPGLRCPAPSPLSPAVPPCHPAPSLPSSGARPGSDPAASPAPRVKPQ